jgi:hypothetical protein
MNETITILYNVKNDTTRYPNALLLETIKDREILLIDILNLFVSLNLSVLYSFWLETENSCELILIKSPSSVVPVRHNRQIVLVLKPAEAPPIVPPILAKAFSGNSRNQNHSPEYCKEKFTHGMESKGQSARSSSEQVRPSSFDESTVSVTDSGAHRKSDIDSTLQSSKPERVKSVKGFVGENVDFNAAKEAAGTIGRSLFSLASRSLQTAVSVAAAASSHLTRNQTIKVNMRYYLRRQYNDNDI